MTRVILVVAVCLAACSDDDKNRHLGDAPPVLDALVDTPDAPPADPGLSITTLGTGTGRITSTPVGIDCGAECGATFPPDTLVTLTAEADASSQFESWGGACNGTAPVCEVTLSAAAQVTATFTLKTYTVMVEKLGAGAGTVSGSGIDCGSTCQMTVSHGTAISLAAAPVALNNFVGWGGACTGMATCDLTITDNTAITAAFALDEISLIVSRGGNGTGSVVSNPTGISCPGTCDFVFPANQMVTLTASPAASSNFMGWTGACTADPCIVTMDAAKAVTATFTLKTFLLQVTKNGNGSGNVTSDVAGIACGSDCSELYNHNTTVVLTATATVPGSEFAGWSGAGCTGLGTCTVSMTAARNVTATFNKTKHAVTVTALTGNGQVDSSPAGITACTAPGTAACTALFDYGTVVTLSPSQPAGTTAANASVFAGWGGACAAFGTADCVLTITTDVTVTATFRIAPNIMFTTSRTYTGALPNIQAECDALAAAGGLSGAGPGQNKTWISMISYSTTTTFASLLAAAGNPTGWARPDGRAVFNTLADLAASRVFYPPRLDEKGNDLGEAPRVWTGTNADGTFNSRCFFSGTTVIPWAGPQGSAYFGLASASSSMLATFRPGDTTTSTQTCDVPAHLYCMGVDRKATVGEPRSPGRVAFTSSGTWAMNSGLGAADDLCRAEATSAGLAGTFKAFLPGIDPVLGLRTAIGRFDTTGPTWVRAGDRVPIVRSANDLALDAFRLLATAPNATANGTRISGNIEHWSGARAPFIGADVNDNCNNWSDAGFLGMAGFSGDTSLSVWWNYVPFYQRCASGDTRKILCFEE